MLSQLGNLAVVMDIQSGWRYCRNGKSLHGSISSVKSIGRRIMAASFEQLASDTVNLPRQQRLALAKLLLDVDRQIDAVDAETQWDEEIRNRIKAIDDGTAVGVPYDKIKQDMNARLRSR